MSVRPAILLVIFLISISGVMSCKGPKSKRKAKPNTAKPLNTVSIIVLKNQKHFPTIDTVSKANPIKEVTLSMEASGKLIYLPGEIGEVVEKNQLLARVRTLGLWSQKNAAVARLSEIETALTQAKTDFEQMKTLSKSGAVSKRDFELAEIALKSRRAQLDTARATLGQVKESLYGTAMFADFDGEIAAKYQQAGNFVGMGSPLYRVVDLSEIKIQFGISELEVKDIKVGDIVHLRAIAYPKRKWEGKVHFISPAADTMLGTFPVEVRFPNTVISETEKKVKMDANGKDVTKIYKIRNWAIKAGMTIQARFFKPVVSGFFVPVDAVLKRSGKSKVFVVSQNGDDKNGYAVKMVTVKVHGIYEGWYHISGKEIVDGIRIITTGNSRLRKDSKVVYRSLKLDFKSSISDDWPDALTKATTVGTPGKSGEQKKGNSVKKSITSPKSKNTSKGVK
ncbi:MAG: efflux RND transporter periplasmic adaptor subunit [Deltaproteobacteria bacterium]|nr:efflux RND transporter periplasmic adaptor subunit [Deltaproteobacteria bacterium]